MKIASLRKSFYKGALALAVMLALGTGTATHGYAQGIDLKSIPALKQQDMLPEEEFKKQTKLIEQPALDEEGLLAYRLRLPKGWTDNVEKNSTNATGTIFLSANVLGNIARYISEPVNLKRSYVQIEAQELGYEIGVKNWFISFILNNGFSLTAMDTRNAKDFEALYVQVLGDQTYVVRTRAMINGSKLVLVRYYLPQENYEAGKAMQAQVIDSFELLNRSDKSIEDLQEYAFLDQSYFDYPSSWAINPKAILSVERMSAILLQEKKPGKDDDRNVKPVILGQMKIVLVSRLLKTSLAKEIKNFRDSVKLENYTIQDKIEELDFEFDPSMEFGKVEAYDLVPNDPVTMGNYEFVVAVMQGKDFYYIVSLITPSRTQDFHRWARNLEAFRIVVESVRRTNAPEVDPNDPYYDYLNEYNS